MSASFPRVNIDKVEARQITDVEPVRTLVVGQKIGGTATSGVLVENINNFGQENTAFGADSMAATMVREFKRLNDVSRIDVISLDDDGGAAKATASIVFSGAASEDGKITIYVGSKSNFAYTVDVLETEDPDTYGAKFVGLINGDVRSQVTATYTPGTDMLDFEHKNGGLAGNFITLQIIVDVAGVAQTLTGFSGGTTNPVLTGIFDQIEDMRYNTIVWPITYDIAFVRDFLDARFNSADAVLDGRAHTYTFDTLANNVIFGNAQNSQNLVIVAGKLVSDDDHKGNSMVEFPWSLSSSVVAIDMKRRTIGAQLSELLTTAVSTLDRFGGPALASLPYANTALPGLPTIDDDHLWKRKEVQDLNNAGLSIVSNNLSNTGVLFGEMLTTRKFDAQGNRNDTFKYLNYVETISTIGEVYFRRTKATYAQARLKTGALVDGRTEVNLEQFIAFLTSVYQILGGPDFVLVESGSEAETRFKDAIQASVNKLEGKLIAEIVPEIVTQLREANIVIRPTFDTE